MSNDDPKPERLDAILDGREPPATDAERDMLALAASVKEATPRAGDALRARVRALPEPKPASRGLRGLLASGRRGRMAVAAPVVAAAITAVIAVGVLNRDSGSSKSAAGGDDVTTRSTDSQRSSIPQAAAPPAAGAAELAQTDDFSLMTTPTTPTAPPASTAPPVVQLPRGGLEPALARVRELVDDAGGTLTQSVDPGGGVRLTIALPEDRRQDILTALSGLGQRLAGLVPDATGRIVVVLTEAP